MEKRTLEVKPEDRAEQGLPSTIRLEATITLAKQLKDIIIKEKLWTDIQGKPFIIVEGWGALFAMLGLMPRITSVVKLEDGDGWMAKGELRNSHGDLVSTAVATCGDPKDKPWNSRSVAAQVSMAETRCVGKMGRTIAGHVVKLAGYTATPAEEMPSTEVKSDFEKRTEAKVVMPPK